VGWVGSGVGSGSGSGSGSVVSGGVGEVDSDSVGAGEVGSGSSESVSVGSAGVAGSDPSVVEGLVSEGMTVPGDEMRGGREQAFPLLGPLSR